MRSAIEDFILYLATERGLSENYQLSTRLSLEGFAQWLERRPVVGAGNNLAEDAEAAPAPRLPRNDYTPADQRLPGAQEASRTFRRLDQIDRRGPEDFLPLVARPAARRARRRGSLAAAAHRALPAGDDERIAGRSFARRGGSQCTRGLRDRALLELLYASGLRVSELVNARLENLDLETRIIRVTGKGNKMRLVPVGQKACAALRGYLKKQRRAWSKSERAAKFSSPRAGPNSPRCACGRL